MNQTLVKKWILKLAKIFLILFISFFLLLLVFLQASSIVNHQKPITPSEIHQAKKKIKEVADKLALPDTLIKVRFSAQDLYAVSKLGTHLLPYTQTNISTSNFGVLFSSATEVQLFKTWFFNSRCLLVKEEGRSYIEGCQFGELPVSGWIIEHIIIGCIDLLMGVEVANSIHNIITNINHLDTALVINATKSKFFKRKVNSSLRNIGDIAQLYAQSSDVSPAVVRYYLNQMQTIKSNQLFEYMNSLFSHAQKRSQEHNPDEENSAIVWALAIHFGDYRFASLMGITYESNTAKTPLLRGRRDLAQHFIYSAAIHQLVDEGIGLSIGEAKELIDSISGGSGYSFADLAADKAGLKFAKLITSNSKNAEYAQNLLSQLDNEDAFFPYTHDLPEGIKAENYKKIIGSIDSNNYKNIEIEIDTRISRLKLHNAELREGAPREKWDLSRKWNLNFWHKVDTHIHTKHSDGEHTVAEIAKKSFEFGCDTIAITDHGDSNLKSVLSKNYFTEIKAAKANYPYLEIILGLEWNIPPLGGREHATLLLPKTKNYDVNLSTFRALYDNFKTFDDKQLSPQHAFNWLDKHGADGGNISPVIIYNHPSRKNVQQAENEHDIRYWRKYSDLVIGFSGAPGHQKKQNHKNGSYEYHIKTINGWEPSVENVQGEWDRLLQNGYKVWAARANSDFHNTRIDYWPCQFSSTHVAARSNKHNDIIQGFKSGNFWAQHGNFVQEVNFHVRTDSKKLYMGTEGYIEKGKYVTVTMEVFLNDNDWKGQLSKLDELELIIITEKDINSVKFTEMNLEKNKVRLKYEYKIDSKFAIFRWRGENTKKNGNNYMFYTNPIKINTY